MEQDVLPELTETGDPPPGIHKASWEEIEEKFGRGAEVRVRALARLRHLYVLADRTEYLARFLVFGSFVSAAAYPGDIDIGKLTESKAMIALAPPGYDQYSRRRPPFRLPVDHEHIVDGLHKAGWPG